MPSRMSPTVLCNPPPSVNTPASLVRLTVGRQDGSTALWPPDGLQISVYKGNLIIGLGLQYDPW